MNINNTCHLIAIFVPQTKCMHGMHIQPNALNFQYFLVSLQPIQSPKSTYINACMYTYTIDEFHKIKSLPLAT